jgi:hypothetical protein
MIRGRFGRNTGSPYVEAEVHLSRFDTNAGISFLVDTGADRTVIMPDDGRLLLGLDYSKLTGVHPSVGIGGTVEHFSEEAVLVFTEPGVAVHFYQVEVLISPLSPELSGVPSLLGRDILNNWKMVDAPNQDTDQLTFEVVRSTLSIEIRGNSGSQGHTSG